MIKIALLYGGMSSEHDVSLCSAASVYSALDKTKYSITPVGIDRDGKWHVQPQAEITNVKGFGNILKINRTGACLVNHFANYNKLKIYNPDTNASVEVDFVLPVLHGTNCEDGRLQGLLELAGVPYAGADLLGSAIGMDKDVAKRLMKHGGIPVVPWITINSEEWNANKRCVIDSAVDELALPLFIKPAACGSSIGVSKAKTKDELMQAIEFAFQFDNKLLIEKSVDCREIECAVLGNLKPEASVVGEINPNHEFYSYEAKYIDADGARMSIPAKLDDKTAEAVRQTALSAYRVLCCTGMARVDFFLEKSGSGNFYLNEINTLPGFTSISMYPKLWAETDLKYSDLLDRLIELGFESHRARTRLKTQP